MRVVEDIALRIKELLLNKDVLEVSCGNAGFSLEAVKYARLVLATDISLESYMRRNNRTLPVNLALKMIESPCNDLTDNRFDVSVCYNKLTKMPMDVKALLKEMIRVTRSDGYLVFTATQKAQINALNELKTSITSDKTLKKGLNIYYDIHISKYTMLILQKK